MERHPELTVKMVREVCDGKGSYATYSDAGKLFTIATIVGANSGWEGEEQRHEWANEPDPRECYWQFHEASGDGNDVCPNCGSDFKRD